MSKKIHINKNLVARNRKNGTNIPCIRVEDGKNTFYGTEVIIDKNTRIVQSFDKPLKCGATIYIETETENIEIINKTTYKEMMK